MRGYFFEKYLTYLCVNKNERKMSSGGSRPGAGRKPVPDKRVRLTAYVTPRTMKVLAGMSEDLNVPVGQVIEALLEMKDGGK